MDRRVGFYLHTRADEISYSHKISAALPPKRVLRAVLLSHVDPRRGKDPKRRCAPPPFKRKIFFWVVDTVWFENSDAKTATRPVDLDRHHREHRLRQGTQKRAYSQNLGLDAEARMREYHTVSWISSKTVLHTQSENWTDTDVRWARRKKRWYQLST